MAVPLQMPALGVLRNGDVLVAGGVDGSGNTLASTELYLPTSMSWKNAGTLLTGRAGADLAVLSNGQALVVGGAQMTGNGNSPPSIAPISSAELYTPQVTSAAEGRPRGAPIIVASVTTSALPAALGSAGGAILLLAAVGYVVFRRRRSADGRSLDDPTNSTE